MKIVYLFILILLLSFVNVIFVYTKWSRQVFLLSNILVFLCSLLYWVFFNKLIINLQFCSIVTVHVIDLTWTLVFGLNGVSLFFIILTCFITTVCAFINFDEIYKSSEFNFLLWATQLILLIFFTTSDLIIFFFCFELTLVPIFLMILTWGSTVRRVLGGYYFYMYTSLGAIFMIIGIGLVIMECGTTSLSILEVHKFHPLKQVILFFFFFLRFCGKSSFVSFSYLTPWSTRWSSNRSFSFVGFFVIKVRQLWCTSCVN